MQTTVDYDGDDCRLQQRLLQRFMHIAVDYDVDAVEIDIDDCR